MTKESNLKPFEKGDVFVGATLLNNPEDDHAGALTPETLPELVRRIERIETMLGSPVKEPVPAETRAIGALRVPMREVDFD